MGMTVPSLVPRLFALCGQGALFPGFALPEFLYIHLIDVNQARELCVGSTG